MRNVFRAFAFLAMHMVLVVAAFAQGNSGSIEGVVKDPSGAAIANATVEIKDPVSGYSRTANTSAEGVFRFTNVPFNPYHLSVTADKFASFAQDVEVRSVVPTKVEIPLKIGTEATTIRVESGGGDLLENDPTFHTDVDRNAFAKMPLESASEFARHTGNSRNRRGLEWSVPRTRRTRGELVFGGQPANYRPAKQSLFQSDPFVVHSVAGSHLRCAPGGIWREDQPGD